MAKSKGHPDYLVAAERRASVFHLKKQGLTYRTISKAMIEKYPGRLPKGYDERYAYKDVMAVLDKLNKEIKADAEQVRRMELERLDNMFVKNFTRAVKGDPKAVLSCMRIMDRRSRYLGLDAPTKNEVFGPGGSELKFKVTLTNE